jgi:LPS-assembly lipoprotein
MMDSRSTLQDSGFLTAGIANGASDGSLGVPAPGRRRALRALGAVGVLAALGGCGFALRGTADLPFKTLYVNLEDTSELGAQLRRYVRTTTSTQIVEDSKAAEAQLQVLSDTRERSVLSLDASGRVREFELRYLFTFRLHNGRGYEFIQPTTIMLKRDLTFNDAATLAKESEANLLYRDMQMEVIQQLLRRMAAVEPV